jgi:hypothetical protein
VAFFQPDRAIEFVRTLAATLPTMPAEETRPITFRKIWSRPPNLLHQLPPLLRAIAYHEAHVDAALDLLWQLGRDDSRELNPHPDHAIRVLTDATGYGRGRQLWVQRKAAAALRRWTAQPGWANGAHDPLGVAKAILEQTVTETTTTDSGISLAAVRVRPEVTVSVRQDVLELLGDLALGTEPRGRLRAAGILLDALHRPPEYFAHVVTAEEDASWLPQYEAAAAQLERIATSSADPLVRIRVADGLGSIIRFGTRPEALRSRVLALAKHFRDTPDMRLSRAYGTIYDRWLGRGKLDAYQEQVEDAVRRSADQLVRAAHGNEAAIFQALRTEQERFRLGAYPNVIGPSGIMTILAAEHSHIGVELAARIVSEGLDEQAEWLPPLLWNLAKTQPDAFSCLMAAAMTSPQVLLRRAGTWALSAVARNRALSDEELALLRGALGDDDGRTRSIGVDTVAFGAHNLPRDTVASLVTAVRIGGDVAVVQEMSHLWFGRHTPVKPVLTDAQARALLAELIELPSIGTNQGDLDDMLAHLAAQVPLDVLEFLLERARREAASAQAGDDTPEYDAMPYHGLRRTLSVLAKHPDLAVMQARMKEAMQAGDGIVDHIVRTSLGSLLRGRDDGAGGDDDNSSDGWAPGM